MVRTTTTYYIRRDGDGWYYWQDDDKQCPRFVARRDDATPFPSIDLATRIASMWRAVHIEARVRLVATQPSREGQPA